MKTKDAIRAAVWARLEKEGAARFPGAEGRIPNFVGAERCAALIAESEAWRRARTIKANPDSPQRAIRQRALEEGKMVYMAVPRLRSAKPFIELDPKRLTVSAFRASTIAGAAEHGRPVALEDMPTIGLIVCGSVAVNRRGARVGKGGGYSDLEYALLREAGKVQARTPIVTSVHPLQILAGKIPMTAHDIPLSAIVTPTQWIAVTPRWSKPKGIYWDLLPPEKVVAIPILRRRSIQP